MTDPFVSIILRSFNEAWALRDTLAALELQNYANWELIVIDSGSTDGTLEIVKEFADQPWEPAQSQAGRSGRDQATPRVGNGDHPIADQHCPWPSARSGPRWLPVGSLLPGLRPSMHEASSSWSSMAGRPHHC